MINVLHIGLSYELGGIEQFLINFDRNINKDICKFNYINVFDKARTQNYYKQLEILGGNIYNISDYRKHPLKSFKQIRKIINDNNYKIVHYHMNSACFLIPLIAAKFSNAKVIISHSHNSSSDKGFFKKIIHNINKKFIPLFATDFFACSEKAGKWFFSKKVLCSNKFKIINNAVDIEKFKYNIDIREKIRKNLGIENKLVIGHVGRFNKQKNHTFLIDIFHEIHKRNPDSVLILVGDGELKNSIKEKVDRLNINNEVKFLGIRKDVNELLQAMDIFLLPSLYEGAPVVGIEAQLSGLFCIFSDIITKEIKILRNTKYVSLDISANEWSNIILDEYKKEERQDRLKDMLSINFDIKHEVNKLIKFYEKSLNN